MLIEQDGPGWREKLPEIPVVPLAVQQQHQQKALSAEVAEARAARAAMEEGRWRRFLQFREAVMDLKPPTASDRFYTESINRTSDIKNVLETAILYHNMDALYL